MKRIWSFSVLLCCVPLASFGSRRPESLHDELESIKQRLQALQTEEAPIERKLEGIRVGEASLKTFDVEADEFSRRLQLFAENLKNNPLKPKRAAVLTPKAKARSLTATVSEKTLVLSETEDSTTTKLRSTLMSDEAKNPFLTLTEVQFEQQVNTTLNNIKKIFHSPTQEDIIRIILINFMKKLPQRDLATLLKDEEISKIINQRFALLIKKVNEIYPEFNIQPEASFQAFYEKWKILLHPVEKLEVETLEPVPSLRSLSRRKLRSSPAVTARRWKTFQLPEDEFWRSSTNFQLDRAASSLASTPLLAVQDTSTKQRITEDVAATEWNNVYFRLENRAFSFLSRPVVATQESQETRRSTLKRLDTQDRDKTPTPLNVSVTTLFGQDGASATTVPGSRRGSVREGLALGGQTSARSFSLPESSTLQLSSFGSPSNEQFTLTQERAASEQAVEFSLPTVVRPIQEGRNFRERLQQQLAKLPNAYPKTEGNNPAKMTQPLQVSAVPRPITHESVSEASQEPLTPEEVQLDRESSTSKATPQENLSQSIATRRLSSKLKKKPELGENDIFKLNASFQALSSREVLAIDLHDEPVLLEAPIAQSGGDAKTHSDLQDKIFPDSARKYEPEKTAVESKVAFY